VSCQNESAIWLASGNISAFSAAPTNASPTERDAAPAESAEAARAAVRRKLAHRGGLCEACMKPGRRPAEGADAIGMRITTSPSNAKARGVGARRP
jgi:hypothetical protein